MISICRAHASNVKRWRDGQMALRWCAKGMGEAGKQFIADVAGQVGRMQLPDRVMIVPSLRLALAGLC